MKYLRVRWMHNNRDLPILLFSELNDARWETRSIDIYADGRIGLADANREINGSRLGDQQAPEIEDINTGGELEATEISADEFERAWADAEKSL